MGQSKAPHPERIAPLAGRGETFRALVVSFHLPKQVLIAERIPHIVAQRGGRSECASSLETVLILFVLASRSVARLCRSTCAETAISLEMYSR